MRIRNTFDVLIVAVNVEEVHLQLKPIISYIGSLLLQ